MTKDLVTSIHLKVGKYTNINHNSGEGPDLDAP